jgi:hypothetical protein
MATAAVEPEVQQGVAQKALTTAQEAKLLTVRNPEEYRYACDFLKGVAQLRRQIAETFDPIIEQAHKAHKIAIAKKKETDGPLEVAEGQLKLLVNRYLSDVERKRLAEEARLRDEARKAEEERARREAEERKLELAIEAEQSGDMEVVEEILNSPTEVQPSYIPPVILPSVVEKQAGISRRTNWKARVIDEALVPREFLCVDEQKLNRYAKAMQQKASVLGVEFWDDGCIAVKA